MTYKIVVDSCCDLTPERKADPHFQIVPLTLEIDGRTFIDDDSFDQLEYIRAVAASKDCAHTACPSPEAYVQAYSGEEDMVFVFTLSEHLSGSYNSAVLAMNLFYEEYPELEGRKQIHVFSSDSACCGEAIQAFFCQKLAEQGCSFEEIVEQTTAYIQDVRTYFVLEDMETLKKNGRLTGLAALLVSALNIRPVMSADHGVIIKIGQARGLERALKSMVGHVCDAVKNPEQKTVSITHVNCPERAESVKNQLLARCSFRDVYIVNAAGVSTTYANDGGIVVAV